jgi:hypothetical protein
MERNEYPMVDEATSRSQSIDTLKMPGLFRRGGAARQAVST